jgi:5-methylcytosine-specific restriction endonuclease McrA
VSIRAEFTKATKLAAWERCKGICECGCGQKIIGTPEYHHVVPAALGGSNELNNCQVLQKRCHRVRTETIDVPEIAKSVRIAEKRAGVRKAQGIKGWRRFDGTPVWRSQRLLSARSAIAKAKGE